MQRKHGRIQRGEDRGSGPPPTPMENQKLLYVYLEILVRTPIEKHLDPLCSIASRRRSVRHCVKYLDDFKGFRTLPPLLLKILEITRCYGYEIIAANISVFFFIILMECLHTSKITSNQLLRIESMCFLFKTTVKKCFKHKVGSCIRLMC